MSWVPGVPGRPLCRAGAGGEGVLWAEHRGVPAVLGPVEVLGGSLFAALAEQDPGVGRKNGRVGQNNQQQPPGVNERK